VSAEKPPILSDAEDPELRHPEPTPEGRHLVEPDAFPHVMMARLGAILVASALAMAVLWAVGGIVAALVGAAIALVVAVPLIVVRMTRAVKVKRRVESEQERQLEAQERTAGHAGHAGRAAPVP
jgi:Flp pilus assembly protein TadB